MTSIDRGLGPNFDLVGKPGSRDALITPALVLDLDQLEANIAAMAAMSRASGLAVRPHAKTHKSVEIARRQVAAGAAGVCVANVREAAIMAAAGIDVHITSPVVGERKTALLADLLEASAAISAVVDNMDTLRLLEDEIGRRALRLPVFVDLDLGAMYRSGAADGRQALELAAATAASPALAYSGVQFYSGIVQHIPTRLERGAIYERELDRLRLVLSDLGQVGLAPPAVTGGGTGTFEIDARSGLFTENQAGSYVVLDAEYDAVELGSHDKPFRPALFVQSMVVSNNARGLVTIDAGSKSLATDGPPPPVVRGAPGDAIYQSFGDEFGAVLLEDLAAKMSGGPPKDVEYGASAYELFQELFGCSNGTRGRLATGAKIELMAPHCDPTVNLHDWYHCVRGDILVDIWPVDARGSL